MHSLINTTLDLNHHQKLRHIVNQPYRLWMAIQQMYENQINMAGPMALERLLQMKYEDFPTTQAWLTVQDNWLKDLPFAIMKSQTTSMLGFSYGTSLLPRNGKPSR
jgi:hypothetical protein